MECAAARSGRTKAGAGPGPSARTLEHVDLHHALLSRLPVADGVLRSPCSGPVLSCPAARQTARWPATIDGPDARLAGGSLRLREH